MCSDKVDSMLRNASLRMEFIPPAQHYLVAWLKFVEVPKLKTVLIFQLHVFLSSILLYMTILLNTMHRLDFNLHYTTPLLYIFCKSSAFAVNPTANVGLQSYGCLFCDHDFSCRFLC